MGRKKYSKELKAQIALDAIKGQKTIAELASEYGVSPSSILPPGISQVLEFVRRRYFLTSKVRSLGL